MALTPGSRLGVYEVTAPIGAGGMGEVYRATDINLKRSVAIKVLPASVAADADRLARFQREAEVLAALNHPNIAAIYGLEKTPDFTALVMELVEGDDLSQRIARGPIPLDEALSIAKQIADALAAAHEQGIIHRDLKPANIKIRADGTVKVLDFGLAKVLDSRSVAALDMTPPPTLTVHTHAGVILGTAAYMSPEQAKGVAVDKRADLWAFGAVLYEMLTGRRAFRGEGVSDTMARVLMEEPDWTALPATTPAPIRRLLSRSLQKDRKRRLESAADARFEIEDALALPVERAAPLRAGSRDALVLAAGAGGVALLAIVLWVVTPPRPQPAERPSRFAIVPPPAQPLNVNGVSRDIALSRDGRRLVYRSGGSMIGGSPLMVRAVDQLDAQQIPGVSAALGPFFSADSRWIGFFENGELRKISISGGPVITICPVSGRWLGASWGDDNTIVFATDAPNTGLWRVPADGGQPTVLTTPDAAQREAHHGFPSMLPGGRSVLFTVPGPAGGADNPQVAVLDLKTRARKTLIRGGSDAEYVEPGYLLYAAAGTLRAVRFDPERLEVIGDSVPVVDHVITSATGAANYAVSRTGTLIYVPGGVGAQTMPRTLLWVDRRGHEEPISAPPRAYSSPRLSPDGTQVAVEIFDHDNDLWIWDITRETLRRFTFDPAFDGMPVWSRDGQRIIWASTRSGGSQLYEQAADGAGPIGRLVTNAGRATAITPDGARVIGFGSRGQAPIEIVVSARTTRASEPSGEIRFQGVFAEISPDGRYIAYQSNESGRTEIYVRPFPLVDSGHWQISTGGGTRAVWARSGRELFYLDASNTLIAVPVQTSGSTFTAFNQAKVFDGKYSEPFPARHYDVSADGQRFLMLKDTAAGDPNATPASLVVVLNWTEELKAHVPTK